MSDLGTLDTIDSQSKRPIRVLVVEDSPVVREWIVYILNRVPGISVIATAADGAEAIEAVMRLKPDIVTMDIHMPVMNGLEATRRIMETNPLPIIILSGSTDPSDVQTTFNAMEAGALAFVPRPSGIGHPDMEAGVRDLVQTVKVMSEVKVVRRWPRTANGGEGRVEGSPSRIEVVAIGASTGGPPVLQGILSALPKNFPLPILIVQHMASGFLQGFAEWLSQSCVLPVALAVDGETLQPSRVHVAPDGFQMKVTKGRRIALTRDEPEDGMRPAVSCLFRSVAEVYRGAALAGLLTGMGRDGAKELKLLKDGGAVTFVQDRESAVVYGMPGEAVRLDGAAFILSPDKIAPLLICMANSSKKGRA